MVTKIPIYSPQFKSSLPHEHNVTIWHHNDATMMSQWWDIHVPPVPCWEETYVSFQSRIKAISLVQLYHVKGFFYAVRDEGCLLHRSEIADTVKYQG